MHALMAVNVQAKEITKRRYSCVIDQQFRCFRSLKQLGNFLTFFIVSEVRYTDIGFHTKRSM